LLVLIFSVLSPDFDGVVPGTGGHSDAAVGHGDSGDSVIVPRQVSVVISFEEIPHVNGGIVGSGEENASGFREGHARQTVTEYVNITKETPTQTQSIHN